MSAQPLQVPATQTVRLYLISDEPVLGNATVVTALIVGSVPFRDFEAWVNPAEFNGPDKYDGRLNFPVAAAFERTSWRGSEESGSAYFQYSFMTHQMVTHGISRVSRN